MAVPLSTHLEKLPWEITVDIMLRLPIESIIRCKSVCRRWRSLLHLILNDRRFTKLHLQHQKQQIASRGNQYDFLIKLNPDTHITRVQEFEFLEYSDHDDDGDGNGNGSEDDGDDDGGGDDEGYSILFGTYRVRKVDHPIMINDHYLQTRNPFPSSILSKRLIFNRSVQAIGSCDGIVCVSCSGDPTYICNPVTGEYINLPSHSGFYNPNYSSTTSSSYIVSGFGYHPRNPDEYKVVRIYYSASRDCEGQVEVYTIGKDRGQWRNKEPISHVLEASQRGVLVNGTLYWMAKEKYGMTKLGIVAFDLANEEFYKVARVPSVSWMRQSPGQTSIRIRELGGYLSLILNFYSHTISSNVCYVTKCTVVWTMKNCTRNNESWVKEFNIPVNWNNVDPFNLTKNSEILAWYNNQDCTEVSLAGYNPNTGIDRGESDETMVNRNASYGAVAHIKSFISMKHLGEEDTRQVGGHYEKVLKVNMPRKRKALSSFKYQ